MNIFARGKDVERHQSNLSRADVLQKTIQLIHQTAERLRTGRRLQVANYYIGDCFRKMYEYLIMIASIERTDLDDNLKVLADELKNTKMLQEEADIKSIRIIREFIRYCIHLTSPEAKISHENIMFELEKIEKNRDEEQQMIDTRFATIFEEIAKMLEVQGSTLFE